METQDLEKYIQRLQKAYDKSVQQNMEKYMQHVNGLIEQSQKDMQKLIQEAQGDKPVEKQEEKPRPQAVWTEEQGQKLLVLNEAAASFFMAIFDNVGELTKELEKLTSKKAR